jgi:hypothetical protein
MINGAQCTILWHVDDLKISHVDKAVVEKMLSLGPDTDNYKKLRRVIQYLRGTQDMSLMLEADDTRIMKWWVDASYAVHPDMRSHTGDDVDGKRCHARHIQQAEVEHVQLN